jgi:hypothetical protein
MARKANRSHFGRTKSIQLGDNNYENDPSTNP